MLFVTHLSRILCCRCNLWLATDLTLSTPLPADRSIQKFVFPWCSSYVVEKQVSLVGKLTYYYTRVVRVILFWPIKCSLFVVFGKRTISRSDVKCSLIYHWWSRTMRGKHPACVKNRKRRWKGRKNATGLSPSWISITRSKVFDTQNKFFFEFSAPIWDEKQEITFPVSLNDNRFMSGGLLLKKKRAFPLSFILYSFPLFDYRFDYRPLF